MHDVTPNKSERVAPIEAVCLHWTGGTFASAVDWCMRPEAKVSYHTIIAPDGTRRDLVPIGEWTKYATWSVGTGREPEGFPVKIRFTNMQTINIALAGGPPVMPTPAAVNMCVALVLEVFLRMKWGRNDLWRLVGHKDMATFPKDHEKAGQYGRKPDPWDQGWLVRSEIVEQLTRLLGLVGV